MSLLKAFNTHYFDFLDNIINIIADNKEINLAKITSMSIKKANPTFILKVWYKFVYIPYNNVISKGDYEFIINKDYKNDISELKSNGNSIVLDDTLDIINKIREPIRQMNEQQKTESMKYIQNLTKLSHMYHMIQLV